MYERPTRYDKRPIFAAFLVLLVAVIVPAAPACGASTRERQRDELLDAYRAEAERCESRIEEIVDRTGTTRAQDDADLATEQERCSEALTTLRERAEASR